MSTAQAGLQQKMFQMSRCSELESPPHWTLTLALNRPIPAHRRPMTIHLISVHYENLQEDDCWFGLRCPGA